MAELFERFAVDRVPRWPLVTRLLALSVVLHGLFLLTVMYVPSLRSILRVAGSVAGIEFVSEDYDRSLVGQRATIVKLEPHEKLFYPTDYFGPPPDPFASAADPMLIQQAAPPPPPPPVIIRQPRRARTPRVRTMPTPEAEPSPEVASSSPSPTPVDEKKAEEELNRLAAEKNLKRPPQINVKPFVDIAQRGKQLVDEGKLNLNSSLNVRVVAPRNEDGTLDRERVKIEGMAGDETMSLLASEFINVLSESKVFVVLQGAKQVEMTLRLDEQNVLVNIASDVESEARSKEMAEGFAGMLITARMVKKGTTEGELWERLKVSYNGTQVLMSFEMPKGAAGKMIADMLAKKAAEGAGKSE